MDETGRTDVVSFDATAALSAVRSAVDGPVYAFVAYTDDAYDVFHLHDEMRALYPDRETMDAHFELVHSYVHLDFAEQRLFEESLFTELGRVDALVTLMGEMTLVRVLSGREGTFFLLDPDESATDAARAAGDVVERSDGTRQR
jgi:hypothetical protein